MKQVVPVKSKRKCRENKIISFDSINILKWKYVWIVQPASFQSWQYKQSKSSPVPDQLLKDSHNCYVCILFSRQCWWRGKCNLLCCKALIDSLRFLEEHVCLFVSNWLDEQTVSEPNTPASLCTQGLRQYQGKPGMRPRKIPRARHCT